MGVLLACIGGEKRGWTLAHGTDAEAIPSRNPLLRLRRLLAVWRNPFPGRWILLNSASLRLFRAAVRGFRGERRRRGERSCEDFPF